MDGHARNARLAVAAGAAAALTACSSGGATPLVLRGDSVALPAGAMTTQDVARAQTAFGVDLLRALCTRAGGENVLVSPTSAAQALGLLHPAGAGRTATALAAVLHLPEWSPELAAAVRDHTDALARLRFDGDLDDDDAPDSLQLSNHLWTAPGVVPAPAYLDDLATSYAADVRVLDFAGDPVGATERINTTIAEETHDIIEELFDQPLPTDTRVVLTNALHLKARWASPFTGTRSAAFAAPSGDREVAMMSGASGTAHSVDGWQAVELPYRDGTLTAVAVLPPEGTDPCGVDAAMLAALRTAEPGTVDVQLPRMRLEETHDLLGPLAGFGLPVDGDFPGLGAGGVGISQVVQKVWLDVDEDGTEAAAATGLAMAISARMPLPVVSFDRPFLFVLTDTATRSPLFLTAVRDPST